MEDLLGKIKQLVPQKTEAEERDLKETLRTTKNKYFNLYTKDLMITLENIQSIIIKNKNKYLIQSNFKFAGFTDEEKDKLESEILTSLRVLEKSLADLNEMLDRKDNPLEWTNKSDYAHKKTAISCLFNRLNGLYASFKKIKDERNKQQRIRSELMTGRKSQNKKSIEKKEYLASTELMEEEKAALRTEALLLLNKYENDLKDVQDTQKKMFELTQVMNTFSTKVFEQEMTTQQILEHVSASVDFVNQGNKHLVDAEKHSKTTGVLWAAYYITLGIIILLLDFLN